MAFNQKYTFTKHHIISLLTETNSSLPTTSLDKVAGNYMSYTHIWGFFLLTESFRSSNFAFDYEPSSENGSYIYYKSEICGINGSRVTWIRIEKSVEIPPLVNNTVAVVMGRLCSQANGDFQVEALHIIPFPKYIRSADLLDLFIPRITVVGHVVGDTHTLDNGTQLFAVNATTYVRDSIQVASVM